MQPTRKKILIFSSSQFGYLTDTLKYCEYAQDEFDITYLGWDWGFQKIHVPGIKVKYIKRHANLFLRKVGFLTAFVSEIKAANYNTVFLNYFRGVFLLSFFLISKRSILDIRTTSVNSNKIKRKIFNSLIAFECLFYKEITIIDKDVAKKLVLNKFKVLPLGGECYKTGSFQSKQLHFLYVGTLYNRNLLNFVKAFKKFLDYDIHTANKPVLTIVGDSSGSELIEIRRYVYENHLNSQVKVIGRVAHNQLSFYFENANIGVSYIPINDIFDLQPPTKTYEYLISGLPVIATKTSANTKIIKSDNNGVLIGDEIDSILKGLLYINSNIDLYNTNTIKSEFKKYNWENIVLKYFVPIMNNNCY